MELDPAQLRALRAAVDEGTLDAAARVLHVTPSAVSQRIRALEAAAGRVLLVRAKPVRPTHAGRSVLRLARQIDLLAADVARELGEDPAPTPVQMAIAVNADSLSTWLLPALAALREEVVFDVRRADEDQTAALLREGTVVAAVTTAAQPLPGCTAIPLGALRYRPVAVPAFAARWFPAGVTVEALRQAPVVHFDRDDGLQRAWTRRRIPDGADPPAHHLPATDAHQRAVLAGFGWGMLCEPQLADLPADAVALLDVNEATDVHLYWQRWKVRSPSLDRLTTAVVAAAEETLRIPTGR